MRDNFRAGDLVRVRDLDDMEAEFGTIGTRGNINCLFQFVPEMHYLCGREFTILGIDADSEVYGLDTDFAISTDMIEHVKREVDIEETEDLGAFLESIKVK